MIQRWLVTVLVCVVTFALTVAAGLAVDLLASALSP